MLAGTDKELEERLEGLKAESQKARRRMEMWGGLAVAGAGLMVVIVFLWILTISLKKPFDLGMTISVIIGGVALFAWGLKLAIGGRKPRS